MGKGSRDKTMECPVCGKHFPRGLLDLTRHVNAITLQHLFSKKESDQYTFGCSKCGLFFSKKEHFDMHNSQTSCSREKGSKYKFYKDDQDIDGEIGIVDNISLSPSYINGHVEYDDTEDGFEGDSQSNIGLSTDELLEEAATPKRIDRTMECMVCGKLFPRGPIDLHRHATAMTLKHLVNKKKSASFPFGCTKCNLYFTSEEHLQMHINHSTCNPNYSWPDNAHSTSGLRAVLKASTGMSPDSDGEDGKAPPPQSSKSNLPTPNRSPMGSFSFASSSALSTPPPTAQAPTASATGHTNTPSHHSSGSGIAKGYIPVEISNAYQSGLGMLQPSLTSSSSSIHNNTPHHTTNTTNTENHPLPTLLTSSTSSSKRSPRHHHHHHHHPTATSYPVGMVSGNISIPTTNSNPSSSGNGNNGGMGGGSTGNLVTAAIQYAPQITIPTVGNSGLAYHVTSISNNLNTNGNTGNSNTTSTSNNPTITTTATSSNPIIPTIATLNASTTSSSHTNTTTTNSTATSNVVAPATPLPTNTTMSTPHATTSTEGILQSTPTSTTKTTPTVIIPLPSLSTGMSSASLSSIAGGTGAGGASSAGNHPTSARKREIYAVDFHSTRQKRMKVIIPEERKVFFSIVSLLIDPTTIDPAIKITEENFDSFLPEKHRVLVEKLKQTLLFG